jgi:hypothetical protein
VRIAVTNLQKSDVKPYVSLVECIVIKEFAELDKMFGELRILIGSTDDIRSGSFKKEEKEFLGNTELVSLTKEIFIARNWANPPKALLEFNLSTFSSYEPWKQKLAIRHECCHLLNFEENPSIFMEFLKKYSQEYLNPLVKFKNEYCAHLCVIKRCPEDWLIEPLGFPKRMQSPSVLYNKTRRDEGRKAALQFCIQNIIHILSVLFLYDGLPKHLKPKVKKKKKTACNYLNDFFRAMKKDLSASFPSPEEWLTPEDFLHSEAYFEKIQKILTLVEKEIEDDKANPKALD